MVGRRAACRRRRRRARPRGSGAARSARCARGDATAAAGVDTPPDGCAIEPVTSRRRSMRSRRACAPRASSSIPGSMTRAHTISSSSRGATAPFMSARPALMTSAARVSWALPKRPACSRSRSSLSAGARTMPSSAAFGTELEHEQVAQPREQVLGKAPGVVAGLDDPVDRGEHLGRVMGRERVDDLVDERLLAEPQQRGGERVGDPVVAGPGSQLVEHRQRVTVRPGASAYDQGERSVVDLHALLVAMRRRSASRVRGATGGTDSGGCASGWSAGPSQARWWQR